MSTILLLEGDDLEALLERARVEGGPEARITRAEKVRSGGVLGFFAKERFEVALEVPERDGDLHPSSRSALPTDTAAAARKGSTMSEATIDRADDPRAAATEGLLGLADRADAQELAISRRPAAGAPANHGQVIDLALARLFDQGEPGAAPAPGIHPSTTRPEFTALLDQLRTTAGTPAAPAPAAPPAAASRAAVPAAYQVTSPAPPAPVAVPAQRAPIGAVPAQRPAPLAPPAPAFGGPLAERQTLARVHEGSTASTTSTAVATRDRREDPQLAADRRALRALGVPVAWTRQLRPGDRFTAVLRMLDRMPDVDIDPATRVLAVVGRAASVQLEAHRIALDLATDRTPRPVVAVPAQPGADRATALTEARFLGDVVVAVESDGEAGVAGAVEALQAVQAGAVIVVVSAADPIERSQAVLDGLGQVDGLAVEGTAGSAEPASVLQLGLPVIRLDGIPIDRYTWTAVLCAQLVSASAP